MAKDVIALTWFPHRRTESLCERFGWSYVVLETNSKGVIRYLRLVPRTVRLLLGLRPKVLVVQSPSLVLASLCVALRWVLRYRLIVDAHNESVRPYIFNDAVSQRIVSFCLRGADLTIVTNKSLADVVVRAGGRAAVLPDPIPVPVGSCTMQKKPGVFGVVVISTFAEDEPLSEIFEAARILGESFGFLVTGNVSRLPDTLRQLAPGNVEFSGFLPESLYWGTLRQADVIVDLTRMSDCLVCGAYEAVSLGKPLVLSEDASARWWFGEAAAYTGNTAKSIAAALSEVRRDYPEWGLRASRAKARIESEWVRLSAEARDRMLGTYEDGPG